jgi:putative oxygen-independent coproporphyrinogen III oxidase
MIKKPDPLIAPLIKKPDPLIGGGLPPLSLYVHVPWCVRKCPYCDFNSHAQQGELPEADYVARLLEDLQQDLPDARGRPLQSIFIGGGTPSLFSPEAYRQLLQELQQRLPFAADIEITLEANPGTAEQDKFAGYRAAGINRLSIGVQSFDAGQLKTLGRIHDRNEALRAAQFARAAGFDNFNLDLMFALPSQSTQQALADLEQAMACQPAHLSWYQLTIEPNTEFFSRPPVVPEDDAVAEMQDAGMALLQRHGYQRYEISAYAQPGRQARHNLNYWLFGDYLGIGAGAHGKLTLTDGSIVRTRKTRMPTHYLDRARNPLVERRSIARDELPFEFMMNALRLCEGCSSALFPQRTGLSLADIEPALHNLRQRGLLQPDPERLCASETGLRYLNELLLAFM